MIKILEKGGSLSLNNSTNQFHTMLPANRKHLDKRCWSGFTDRMKNKQNLLEIHNVIIM